MPNLADLMTSSRSYPAGPTAPAAPRTVMEPSAAPDAQMPAAVDAQAFGQTLAAYLAQSGMADASSAKGITKGSTPGQFTLPWGTETLHLLSIGSKASPSPEELVIVPPEAYDQFGKTRGAKQRQAIVDSIVQGTTGGGSTIMGGGA